MGESLTVTTTTTTATTIEKRGAPTNIPLDQRSQYHPYSDNINNINASPGTPLPYYSTPESGWEAVAPPPQAYTVSSPPSPHVGFVSTPPPMAKPITVNPPSLRTPSPVHISASPLTMNTLVDDNSIVVGLKVYTKKNVPTIICGRVRDSGRADQL